jgi:hypothetical protein
MNDDILVYSAFAGIGLFGFSMVGLRGGATVAGKDWPVTTATVVHSRYVEANTSAERSGTSQAYVITRYRFTVNGKAYSANCVSWYLKVWSPGE